MKGNKESALKALAKRPKLFAAIEKGTEFHKLKDVGQVSGGFIRQLMWAGVAQKDENGIVTFVKGIKKSSLPEVDKEPLVKEGKKGKGKDLKKKPKTTHSEGPTTRVPKRALDKLDSRKKSSKTHAQSDVEVTSKKGKGKGSIEEVPEEKQLSKREMRIAARAERKRIREEKRAIKQRNKKEKEEVSKPGKIEKKAQGKLLRPVKGIPANLKINLEYQDGFWWASDKNDRFRIASTNIKFV